jgi:hypothetical protein
VIGAAGKIGAEGMAEESHTVGVIVDRRVVDSPWIDHSWSPVAVVKGMPEASPMTSIEKGTDFERFYLGASRLVLASSETTNYRDNLIGGAPRLWVVLREAEEDGALELVAVTADPAEGEGHTEAGSNIVDTVPMVPEIANIVAAFVDAHHVERVFFKRQRDRPAPDRGGRRPRDEGMG